MTLTGSDKNALFEIPVPLAVATNRLRRFPLIICAALASLMLITEQVQAVEGKRVVLLLDVSGSMGQYGDWQPDAAQLIGSVLSGSPILQSRWRESGDPNAIKGFVINSGDSATLLEFGSIRQNSFPYFATPRNIEATHLDSGFPMSRGDYREAKTNKPLAMAVGSKISAGKGRLAYLVMISDFLADNSIDPDQQRFVNDFESQAQLVTPLIFTWRSDARVQVKLIRVDMKPDEPLPTLSPNDEPHVPTSSIQLFPPQNLPGRGHSLQFRWKLIAPVSSRSYIVSVIDAKSNKIILTRDSIFPTVTWTSPVSGNYLWQVNAMLENDVQIASPAAPFSVKASNSGLFLIVLLVLAALGILFYLRSRQKAVRRNAPQQTGRL